MSHNPKASTASAAIAARETAGWRQGKPVEDPDKVKRWGFVTAKPSEFLVHVRGGEPTSRCGQGATCFKWPWDSVSIIPTSLQRLQFRADQVTLEKVGVEVVGFAVFRIADPLLAFRVLNFSYPESAQEKLESTLTSMFIGATRRLVASLTVEDCLQKRKSALAHELLREIAPVVGGDGRPDNDTDRGWGVVIDTIEIQEVRVLSEKVFAAMQAPYRSSLERSAREARALAEKEVATREAKLTQEIEETRIESEALVREKRVTAERRAREEEGATRLRRIELERTEKQAEIASGEEIERARMERERRLRATEVEAERARAEADAKSKVMEHELEKLVAEASIAVHELRVRAQEVEAELRRGAANTDAEVGRTRAELALVEGQAETDLQLRRADISYREAEAAAKRLMAERLPELANAVGQRIGEVRIAQYGADGNPFAQVGGALRAILDLAKSDS